MFKFFHHLFNPHCPDCQAEKECISCITLRAQLTQANYERQQLLEAVLNFGKVPETIPVQSEEFKPVFSKHMPWNVRRQMLEQEDRVKAELMKKAEKDRKDIEELEKELKIVSDEKETNNGSNGAVTRIS